MSKLMFDVVLILIGLTCSAWASLNLHGQPLLSGVTSFTLEMETVTTTKPTTCYTTSGQVTQCRRKRGMIEKPMQFLEGQLKIVPSTVIAIETTPVPRAINAEDVYNSYKVYSSFDDSYRKAQNVFYKMANNGRRNYVTVGNCGMSTVNFSEFIACLGMTVQETSTITATFRETSTISEGYTTMTVIGCTPAGFPYLYCPAGTSTTVDSSTTTTTTESAVTAAVTPTEPVTDSPVIQTTLAPSVATVTVTVTTTVTIQSPATTSAVTESTTTEPTTTESTTTTTTTEPTTTTTTTEPTTTTTTTETTTTEPATTTESSATTMADDETTAP